MKSNGIVLVLSLGCGEYLFFERIGLRSSLDKNNNNQCPIHTLLKGQVNTYTDTKEMQGILVCRLLCADNSTNSTAHNLSRRLGFTSD